MQEEIAFFITTNMSPDISCLILWNALKAYLRGQIIAYTAQVKRKSHQEQSDLAHQIRDKQYAQTKCPDLYKKRLELRPDSICSPPTQLNNHFKE